MSVNDSGMDALWALFVQTGAPEAYLLYRLRSGGEAQPEETAQTA